MNRREFGFGSFLGGLFCHSERYRCQLHGEIDSCDGIEIEGAHFFIPELVRVRNRRTGWRSGPICAYCLASEMADICSIRIKREGVR